MLVSPKGKDGVYQGVSSVHTTQEEQFAVDVKKGKLEHSSKASIKQALSQATAAVSYSSITTFLFPQKQHQTATPGLADERMKSIGNVAMTAIKILRSSQDTFREGQDWMENMHVHLKEKLKCFNCHNTGHFWPGMSSFKGSKKGKMGTAVKTSARSSTECIWSIEEVTPGNIEAVSPSDDNEEEVFSDADDDEMPEIRIYDKSSEGIFEQASYDDDGIISDFNNLPDVVDGPTNQYSKDHDAHPQVKSMEMPIHMINEEAYSQEKTQLRHMLQVATYKHAKKQS
ncbi:hypothetical protein Tco_0256028 [Tanacetum coccineum]